LKNLKKIWPKGKKGYDEELVLIYLAHKGYNISQAYREIHTLHSSFKEMRKVHKKGKKIFKHEREELKLGG